MRGRFVRRTWKSDPTLYAPPRYRRACSYEAFIPDPISDLELSLPGTVAGVVSEAEQAISDLNRTAAPELMPLARLLLRTESIASSKVEGMQVDAHTLARAQANQETGRHVGPEAQGILANIDAMQLAIENATGDREINIQGIQAIHRVLLERDPRADTAGHIRTTQNWIGGNDYNPCGADFVPSPPEDVDRLLLDLCAFANSDMLPPLVQAAIAHAQFETIHPFEDGNGRTGRALIQVILRRRGLAPSFVPPISIVLARTKEHYISGLTRFREDRIADWVESFAESAAAAAQLAARYVTRVGDLQSNWRRKLEAEVHPRTDSVAWTLIEMLPAHPVITTAVGTAVTTRTRPAVANAIAQLQAAGILRPLGESVRNRAWEARELLDLIASLESGVG